MSYGNNFSNCSNPKSELGNDFFQELYENRPSKIFSVIFSALAAFLLLILVYGIAWHEHFGSDKKRTMINKLASSLCWTWFEWVILVQLPDMVRYIFGPFPQQLCSIQIALKNAMFTQALLYLDGIIITRYIFIFWLKNPTIFQDDFWNLFLNIWIFGFVHIIQFIYYMMPGRNYLNFYICSGQNPFTEQQKAFKAGFMGQLIAGFSIVVHIFVFVKISLYKKKIKVTGFNIENAQSLKKKIDDFRSIETDSLTDITTSICSAAILSISAFMAIMANNTSLQDFNCFPGYLYEYFFRMVWPNLLTSIFVLLYYYRNPMLRTTVKREYLNFIHDFSLDFH